MTTSAQLQLLKGLTSRDDFRARVESLLEHVTLQCAPLPYRPHLLFGVRTATEQFKLFAKGRRLRGTNGDRYEAWEVTGHGRLATKALPRDSPHCWGAAVDIPLIDRATGHWMPDDDLSWSQFALTVTNAGLVSGHNWTGFRDSAHVELPNWKLLRDQGLLHFHA